jgi:hypothetical protein
VAPSTTFVPRVHVADPVEATPLARAVRDTVAGVLVERPDRRAAFERLRGRVALQVRHDGDAAGAVLGLVFDRGTLTVWDGAPPGGAALLLVVPGAVVGPDRSRRSTLEALLGRRLRSAGAVRHARLARDTLRLLDLV